MVKTRSVLILMVKRHHGLFFFLPYLIKMGWDMMGWDHAWEYLEWLFSLDLLIGILIDKVKYIKSYLSKLRSFTIPLSIT
jgi:hypothetical protein